MPPLQSGYCVCWLGAVDVLVVVVMLTFPLVSAVADASGANVCVTRGEVDGQL
jgi:hypothetical protein